MALSCHNATSISFLNNFGGQTSHGKLAALQTSNWRMPKMKQTFQKLTAQARLGAKTIPDLEQKIMLDDEDMPHQRDNLIADLSEPASSVVNPETHEPFKTGNLIPLSPEEMTTQETSQRDVEPAAQSLTKGVYVDATGGLHYHGMTPLVSRPNNMGSVEASAIPQNESFQGTLKKPASKAQAQNLAKTVKGDGTVLTKKTQKIKTSITFHQTETLKIEQNPKDPSISGSSKNTLDQYEVLKYALITESTLKKMEVNNTLVFVVDVRADKKMIRNAVKNIYNIQTKKVNTLIRPDGLKKAYLMLKPDSNALDVANEIGII